MRQVGSNYTLVGDSERHCIPVQQDTTQLGSKSSWNGTLPTCRDMGHPVMVSPTAAQRFAAVLICTGQEREVLLDFFNATKGPQWIQRHRLVTPDLFVSGTGEAADSVIGEFGHNTRYKDRGTAFPLATTDMKRSVGWNSSSDHGCNTDTCHCNW